MTAWPVITGNDMIRLYTWSTPNGVKISIALEEFGLDYEVITVDINKDEQFSPEFLSISPNNKIPAIVDGDVSLFDSGAILLYLAHKTGELAQRLGGLGCVFGRQRPAIVHPVCQEDDDLALGFDQFKTIR